MTAHRFVRLGVVVLLLAVCAPVGVARSFPPRQALVLSRQGIGPVRFGLNKDTAVSRLSRLFGRPSRPFPNSGCGPRYSEVAWGHLYAEFRLGKFSGFRYMLGRWLPQHPANGGALQGLLVPKPHARRRAHLALLYPRLATANGISLLSTLGQLRAAYGRLDLIGTDRWQTRDGLIFYTSANLQPPPASSRIVEIKFGTCGDF